MLEGYWSLVTWILPMTIVPPHSYDAWMRGDFRISEDVGGDDQGGAYERAPSGVAVRRTVVPEVAPDPGEEEVASASAPPSAVQHRSDTSNSENHNDNASCLSTTT